MAGQLTEGWNLSIWGPLARLLAEPAEHHREPVAPSTSIRRQHRNYLSTDQVSSLIADYQAGMSATAVAGKYYVATDTAIRWIKVNNIPIRPQGPGLPRATVQEAATLREQGWTWHQLGDRCNRSHTAIRNAVLKLDQSVESS